MSVKQLLRMACESMVAGTIFYAVVCLSSSRHRKLNLIKKGGSVLVVELDALHVVE